MELWVPPADASLIDGPRSIALREGCRWGGLTVNLLAVAGVVAMVMSHYIPVYRIDLFIYMAIFLYIVYIVTMIYTNDLGLWNMRNSESGIETMRSMQATPPLMTMTVQCWHRQVYIQTRTDKKGKKHYQSHTRRVDTQHMTEVFEYDSFTTTGSDATAADATAFALVRLHATESIFFADKYTKAKFRLQSGKLQREYRPLDQYMDYRESFVTPNFEPVIFMVNDASRLPWWMNRTCHIFAVLFLCGWPFSMAVQWCSVKVEISMVKRVTRRERYAAILERERRG